ncbi:MAG: HAD family phosphatase [Ruminiclostridium sp.]|nr:HAD family phosphatase [Ruminiclostridium sp.]
MIKAVLFDMDGTVLDTEPLSKLAWSTVLTENGYEFTDEMFYKHTGLNPASTEKLYKSYLGADFPYYEMRAKVHLFRENYRNKHGIAVKKGFHELSDYLRSKGIKAVIATSTPVNEAEKYLKIAGILDRFDFIIGGDQIEKGKPDPEIYLKAAAMADTDIKECIAVEDSTNGILSALSAGLKCVYIHDFSDISAELEKKCIVCNDLADIINLIERSL